MRHYPHEQESIGNYGRLADLTDVLISPVRDSGCDQGESG